MIHVKNATLKDLDEVVKLEEKIWPEGTRAPKDKFEVRLITFPEGFFIAYDDKKGTIGVSTSQIIQYDENEAPLSWEFLHISKRM